MPNQEVGVANGRGGAGLEGRKGIHDFSLFFKKIKKIWSLCVCVRVRVRVRLFKNETKKKAGQC